MNSKLLLSASVCLLVAGCSIDVGNPDEVQIPQEEPVVNDIVSGAFCPGVLTVKFSDEMESTEAVAELLSEAVNVKSVRPTFPDDPRFTERHREAGLHLWFTVQYDEDEPLTKASHDISALPGVELAEGVPMVRNSSFNDPMLYRQWHYMNTAQQKGYVAGSDISLEEAWEYTTGSPDVIVAVLDCGIRYTHEELKDNMWVNEAELGGLPGVDDDGNGYVDDIYGYNFCYVESYYSMHGTIVPEDHGTHVAGTIAAGNNNGKGGCGIAGGDGKHRGVKVMCCQIIQNKSGDENYPSDAGAAFVYAADNGAVISNNSWSGSRSSATQQAIAYFNMYAGCDKGGNQRPGSMMKGGVAFFAAGNDNVTTGYPAMYDEAYAVASIGPDFKRAYYSNYGTWVDICAPGGDQVAHGYVNGGVYSCTAGSDSSYDYYQGTSMACPHVTGVAALAVSAFGGNGFTREDLIGILEDAADKSVYDYNPSYSGKLGIGLVDAGAMFDGSRPMPVTDLEGTASKNTVTLTWTVPAADEGHSVTGFEITVDGETVMYETPSAKSGDVLQYTFSGLEFDKLYSFTIRAVNNEGVRSKVSSEITVRTDANRAPEIVALDGTSISLGRNAVRTLRFSVNDIEGDPWTCKVQGKTTGLGCVKVDGSTVAVEFRGAAIYSSSGIGTFSAVLYVTDESGSTSSVQLEYTVLNHLSPALKVPLDDRMIAGIGNRLYVTLSDYFESDASVTAFVQMDNDVASWIEDNGVLRFTARRQGEAAVTVRIVDRYNEEAEGSFRLVVSASASKAEIYPTTVRTVFYVRAPVSRDINVRLVSQSGQTLLRRDYKDVGPFSPASVDIPASCAPGAYTAIVGFTDGSQVKQTIIRL